MRAERLDQVREYLELDLEREGVETRHDKAGRDGCFRLRSFASTRKALLVIGKGEVEVGERERKKVESGTRTSVQYQRRLPVHVVHVTIRLPSTKPSYR
jgi:hypothetical protein